MANTPLLGILEVAASQDQKEVTINDAIIALENAGNAVLAVTFASNAATLSAAQFKGSACFSCSGQSANAVLTVPLAKRLFVVNNTGSFQVTVGGASGTTAVVAAASAGLIYCDATNCVAVGGGPSTTPYDLSFFASGVPVSSQVLLRFTAVRAVTFPAALTGSKASAGTAATASTVLNVQAAQGGSAPNTFTTVGTITFGVGAATATFAMASPLVLAAGDVVRVVAPASADATLANIAGTLVGTR
jgi:hypothetical protein